MLVYGVVVLAGAGMMPDENPLATALPYIDKVFNMNSGKFAGSRTASQRLRS